MPITFRAPAFFNTRIASFMVAPVVMRSSIMMISRWKTFERFFSFMAKLFLMFLRRSCLWLMSACFLVCFILFRSFLSKVPESSFAKRRAMCSHWLVFACFRPLSL